MQWNDDCSSSSNLKLKFSRQRPFFMPVMATVIHSECQEIIDRFIRNRSELSSSCKSKYLALLDNYNYVIDDRPCSLLQEMLDWEDGVAVVCVYARNQRSLSRKSEGSQNGVVSESEHTECALDITGTPLECPFDLNKTEESISIINGNGLVLSLNELPVSLKEAGILFNVLKEFIAENVIVSNKLASLPFIIKCDAQDYEGTLYIGLQKKNNTLHRFRIVCNGKATETNKIQLLAMKNEHIWGISHGVIETKTKAVYNILQRENTNLGQSNIDCFCSWNDACDAFEVPNSGVSSKISLDVFLGDVRSSARGKWDELTTLLNVANGLESGEVKWKEMSDTESTVIANIMGLLEDMKISGFGSKKRYGKCNPKGELDVDLFTIDMPRDMDFLDKLWLILKNSTSYDDLRTALMVVLETLHSGDIKPVIFSNNRTNLAKIVSNAIHDKSVIPKLYDDMILLMLVEIGIEKMKQDYTNIFLGSNLVTRDNLSPFFSRDSLNWKRDLQSLRKLHCVIELVVLCQTFINPSHAILGNFARTALNELIHVNTMEQSYRFTFDVEQMTMKALQNRISPVVWQISMTSHQNLYIARTVYRMSTLHPNEPLVKEEQSGNVDQKTPLYYTCVATIVQDVFL